MRIMAITGPLAAETEEPIMDLPMYNGKRIAVVLSRGGLQRVLCGLAEFEKDEDLGPIVRIRLQEDGRDLPGNPAVILQADAPAECLVADGRVGYDFRLDLGAC